MKEIPNMTEGAQEEDQVRLQSQVKRDFQAELFERVICPESSMRIKPEEIGEQLRETQGRVYSVLGYEGPSPSYGDMSELEVGLHFKLLQKLCGFVHLFFKFFYFF